MQAEVDVAEILVGAVVADAFDERRDLSLRAVHFDAAEFVLEGVVVAVDFQIWSLGEVAVDRHFKKLRDCQRCSEFRPDIAGRVKQADEQFIVRDVLIALTRHDRSVFSVEAVSKTNPTRQRGRFHT